MTYELILTPEAQRHLKSIEGDKVIVTVISLKGHYNDK